MIKLFLSIIEAEKRYYINAARKAQRNLQADIDVLSKTCRNMSEEICQMEDDCEWFAEERVCLPSTAHKSSLHGYLIP